MALPPGYQVTQGGETRDSIEVFGRILFALGVALMLMYLVLVVQFGSFLDPLAILLSLPLSLIGVMLALLVTGSTLNIMSMIGVILLMGIVAKNAILLIDFAKWAEENGADRRAAIIEAGRVRLRPILMTTFALIAGMLPVAIGLGEGADFRAPLGRAVIGGVLTSTILTLLVIPTVYEIMSNGRDWILGRFRRQEGAGAHGDGRAPAPEGGPLPSAAHRMSCRPCPSCASAVTDTRPNRAGRLGAIRASAFGGGSQGLHPKAGAALGTPACPRTAPAMGTPSWRTTTGTPPRGPTNLITADGPAARPGRPVRGHPRRVMLPVAGGSSLVSPRLCSQALDPRSFRRIPSVLC